MDFFGLNDLAKAQVVQLALSQAESFQLAATDAQGQRFQVTCEHSHGRQVDDLFHRMVLPGWQRDPAATVSLAAGGLGSGGGRPNLIFFSDARGQLEDPERSGAWGALHVADQALLVSFCHDQLGTHPAEARLLGELCFGLASDTVWSLYRDADGGICATPVSDAGCFRRLREQLQAP